MNILIYKSFIISCSAVLVILIFASSFIKSKSLKQNAIIATIGLLFLCNEIAFYFRFTEEFLMGIFVVIFSIIILSFIAAIVLYSLRLKTSFYRHKMSVNITSPIP
jgi:hypothetical protein